MFNIKMLHYFICFACEEDERCSIHYSNTFLSGAIYVSYQLLFVTASKPSYLTTRMAETFLTCPTAFLGEDAKEWESYAETFQMYFDAASMF